MERILKVLLAFVLCGSTVGTAFPQGNPPLAPNVQEGIGWEPSIALDPTDPSHQHLILGNGFELRASNDGGKTFSRLTGTNNLPGGWSCGDGVVTFDSKGHLFWIHLECANGIGTAAVAVGFAGTGYQVGDTLTVQGGNNGTVQVTSVDSTGAVSGITIPQAGGMLQEGSGYSPWFSTTGGHGSNCLINVTDVSSTGSITAAVVEPGAGGSGYKVGDILTVVESGASGGTVQVTAVDSNNAVTGIIVMKGGSGYTDGLPTTGGHGAGCKINITAISSCQAAVDQINPASGNEVGQIYLFPSESPWGDDKPWIAADANSNSPHADNVYAVWSRDVFISNTDWYQLYFSKYDPKAQTWSPPVSLTASGSCAVWPAYVAVAKNGDVYVTYRWCNPAEVQVLRSTDGGASFLNGASSQQPVTVIPQGQDNFNANVPQTIPHDSEECWAPGAYLVQDDKIPSRLYVVTNTTASNDPISDEVVISVSTDSGSSWTPATRVGNAPPGTIQLKPFPATDGNGNLVIKWYDNRDGLTDPAGNYEFNVYATISGDGGKTWAPDFQLNTQPIIIDDSWGRHLQEYAALAGQQGLAYASWIDDENPTSLCFPGCFDVFSTAPPADSITATATGGGCAYGEVQAVVTDGSGKPVQGQSIQFSAPPRYPFVFAGAGSSITDVNGKAWSRISNPGGLGGVVLVKAVDVDQPPPQNVAEAFVSFSSALQCKLNGLAKCAPDVCGPYRVPGMINEQTIIGCSYGPCDHPGVLGGYEIPVGENFAPVEVQLRTAGREEAAQLSNHVHVRVLDKASALSMLKSNPDVVSPQTGGRNTNFVGPVVEIKADPSVPQKNLAFDVTLPHSAKLPPGMRLDIVRLVSAKADRRWSAAGDTVTNITRTTISAHVVGSGIFTVIAQRLNDEPGGPYSHGEKSQQVPTTRKRVPE